jgi:hypothetical protein
MLAKLRSYKELMFVSHSCSMILNLFEVDDLLPHEGIHKAGKRAASKILHS